MNKTVIITIIVIAAILLIAGATYMIVNKSKEDSTTGKVIVEGGDPDCPEWDPNCQPTPPGSGG